MAFKVNEFRTEIANKGLMRTNKFHVRIAYPQGMPITNNFYVNYAQSFEFWCEASTLPGVAVLTSNIKRYGFGVAEKKPDGVNFTDVTLSFLVDEKANTLKFFRDWVQIITNFKLGNGSYPSSATLAGPNGDRPFSGITQNHYPYEVAYKSDYISDIEITTFKETGEPIETVILREAFPIAVGNIDLNWGDTNGITRLPVTFTFYDWDVRQ